MDSIVQESPAAETRPASPWLNAEEAAAYVRLSTKTLYREVARCRCRAARVGGRKLVFRREWLDSYLEQRATPVDVAPLLRIAR